MNITIVGTGYVGLVTGTCLANSGNRVTCLDLDESKIETLNQGHTPIYEPGLEELIARNVKGNRLSFTTSREAAYQKAEAIFICVGTPPGENGMADLKFVLAAARDIAAAIDAHPPNPDNPPIVIVKSTVPVGTNPRVAGEIASHTDKPFTMASNPEFLKEGAAINDFLKPDRVVVGADDRHTGQRLRDLYEPFVRQGNPIFIMDIASAEMVKYASNTMLATKISFINEISRLCESFGADIDEVRRGMCSDRRIGNQFLYPGLGYGGSCFPKDVQACISMGQQSKTPTPLLAAVHDVNQQQRTFFTQKLNQHFAGNLTDKKIAIWGIAFKPGTDDIREAPSLTIIRQLLDHGASITAHDPVAHATCRREIGDVITYANDPYAALDNADALVICTDWDEFKNPDFDDMHKRMTQPTIFDGRNLYRPSLMRQHRFNYYSIGRKPVAIDA